MPNKINLINASEPTDLSDIVVLRSIRGNSKAIFIVDTGSPLTIVPYQKAIELNLPVRDLVADEEIGLIGVKHKTFRFPKPIGFNFLCEGGDIMTKEFNPLIAKPMISKKNENRILTEVILGLDFLEKNNLVLFCDMKNKIAYLEESF